MKAVKVGPITYTIEERDERDSFGEVLYGPCKLYLKRSLVSASKRMTLWHEVIHIILVHAGYRDQDEKLIEVLASGIMQVLQDNPALREED